MASQGSCNSPCSQQLQTLIQTSCHHRKLETTSDECVEFFLTRSHGGECLLKHSPPLYEAQLRTDGASGPPLTGSIVFLLPSDPNAPFAQWNTERVCMWLEDFGLAQYVIFARQWVASGHTLLTATPQDMEKVRSEPLGKEIPIFLQTDAWEVRFPDPPGPHSSTPHSTQAEWVEQAQTPSVATN